MTEFSSPDKIRIKDIAEKAGTSVGTVDRVLHGRPNVSEKVRQRVEEALKELNYEPNRYASALASNKRYRFAVCYPSPLQDGYWQTVAHGIHDAIQTYQDFHLTLEEYCFHQYDEASYHKQLEEILASEPDGVVLMPHLSDTTRDFCKQLQEKHIPFAFLDSNIKDIEALTFYGQESRASGRFSAQMLALELQHAQQILMIHFDIPSLQQLNRERGFKEYIKTYAPHIKLQELTLPIESQPAEKILDEFLKQHPEPYLVCTFCSLTYIIGHFMEKMQLQKWRLTGYDLVEENTRLLKAGTIRYLIAQHPWQQGYGCIDALFNHIVLKKNIKRTNFMPIELLTAENSDYYIRQSKMTY